MLLHLQVRKVQLAPCVGAGAQEDHAQLIGLLSLRGPLQPVLHQRVCQPPVSQVVAL